MENVINKRLLGHKTKLAASNEEKKQYWRKFLDEYYSKKFEYVKAFNVLVSAFNEMKPYFALTDNKFLESDDDGYDIIKEKYQDQGDGFVQCLLYVEDAIDDLQNKINDLHKLVDDKLVGINEDMYHYDIVE